MNGSYPVLNNTACKARIISDTCQNSLDCSSVVNNSECENGTCKCRVGYTVTLTSTECKKNMIGDICAISLDCAKAVQNSSCQNETCSCDPGFYIANNNTMVCIQRLIGDSNCDTTLDCNSSVDNSSCTNGTCLCNVGFHVSQDSSTCIKQKVGDNCSRTADCSIAVPNSECVSGKCKCIIGYAQAGNVSGGISVSIVQSDATTISTNQSITTVSHNSQTTFYTMCVSLHLGDTCINSSECQAVIVNSRCVSLVCACITSYVADGMDKCTRRQLGVHLCLNTSICSAEILNSECINSTCNCVNGYTASADLYTCSKGQW